MAYMKRAYPYEVLVRFGPKGFQGAHQISIEEVFDDETDEILSTKELPPVPIGSDNVDDILGEHVPDLLNNLNELATENKELQERVSDLESALAAKEQELHKAIVQLDVNRIRAEAGQS